MSCVTSIGRVVLIVINVVFLLVSLALIAAGAVLRFFVDKLLPYVGDLNAVDDAFQKKLHVPSLQQVTEFPLVQEAGTALLALGCLLFLLSFCACCGACSQFRPLLIVFSIVMGVLVIAQAILAGLFLSRDSVLHGKIKESLAGEMEEYKEGADNGITIAVNMLNYLLDCCGISGWQDFPNQQPPFTCCKSSVMSAQASRDQCINPASNKDSTFNKMGCYEKLQDKMLSQVPVTAVVVGLIMALQVVEIVFAILIVKKASFVGPV